MAMYEVPNRIEAPDGTSIPPGRITMAEAEARGLLEPKAAKQPAKAAAKKSKGKGE